MIGSYIDHVLWTAADDAVAFNPDSAIYKYWRALKSADPPQFIGLPVTPEIKTEVGWQQGFSSGAVINWSADSGAELANG